MKKSFEMIWCLLLVLMLALGASIGMSAEETQAAITATPATIGGEVTLTVTLPKAATVQALGIDCFYDKDVLSKTSGAWLLSGAFMQDFADDTATLAYLSPVTVSGDILTVTFKVSDAVSCGITTVSCDVSLDGEIVNVSCDVVIHSASTENRDSLIPTCTVKGYTGDEYCVLCGDMVRKGTPIALDPNNHVHTEIRDRVEPTGYEGGYTGDTYCVDCGEFVRSGEVIPKLILVTTKGGEGRIGDLVTVDIVIEDTALVQAIGFFDVIYDSDRFEIVDGEWLCRDAVLSEWDLGDEVASMTFAGAESVNGAIFRLTLRILAGTADGAYEIGFAEARYQFGGENQKMWIETGVITVTSLMRGDMDDDRDVDATDAILSLKCLLFPDRFEKNQNMDFNGDGVVNANDPVYLLRYVLFPTHFPLSPM